MDEHNKPVTNSAELSAPGGTPPASLSQAIGTDILVESIQMAVEAALDEGQPQIAVELHAILSQINQGAASEGR